MRKNIYVSLLVSLLLPAILFAQVERKAPIKMEEPNITVESKVNGYEMSPQVANWVLVDWMANTYGPAIGVLNPIAYDPGADVVALVHRGHIDYATGSGQLWYNLSTDAGLTWARVPGGVNSSIPKNARYPSMAISNPTGGGIAGTTGLFSWPQLNPSAFGFLGYAADQPLGAGAPFAVEDQGPPAYSSQVPCWTEGDYFYWSSDNSTDNSIRIFSTTDFGTITTYDIPDTSNTGSITFGGVGRNGVSYLGMVASGLTLANPIASGWVPGYSMTTNNGVSWSDPVAVDFRTIPALSAYDRLFDFKKGDAFVSYTGDINLDANGYIHLVFAVTDTITADTGVNALVEVFQTASGWDGKVIYSGIDDMTYTFAFNDPALGQMGPAGYLATNTAGNVFACTWPMRAAVTDTICDIFFSYRDASGDWSTPENLTGTPNMNENGAHMAPMLKDNGGGSYTAFVGYFYEDGNFGPVPVLTNKTNFWVAPVTFQTTSVDDEGALVNKFELGQNYPNPFNPSTKISYVLSEAGFVSIKVYDVLGKEVASLVNREMTSGSHSVTFDGTNLASGM
ncbi:MAG: hypothetical protein Q8M94_00660, partial [Ignavibacteria bacterium]|nr:hypothetical protein [Ignavibacteria bacterium]